MAMKELNWAEQYQSIYCVCHGTRPYYGEKANPKELMYICDKEMYVSIGGSDISDGLAKIQEYLKWGDENGYEFYKYSLDTSRDDHGGPDSAHIEIELYRKETEAERLTRVKNMKEALVKNLDRLKSDVIKAEVALKEFKSKLQ